MLRNFIKKTIRSLTINDIKELKEEINRLSPYPWNPKFVIEIKKPQDVEFVARSPEVILKLCSWIEILYRKLEDITFAYNITTCKKCKYWGADPDLENRNIMYGKCHEITNIENFARVGFKTWITPMNFGCLNGEKEQKEFKEESN